MRRLNHSTLFIVLVGSLTLSSCGQDMASRRAVRYDYESEYQEDLELQNSSDVGCNLQGVSPRVGNADFAHCLLAAGDLLIQVYAFPTGVSGSEQICGTPMRATGQDGFGNTTYTPLSYPSCMSRPPGIDSPYPFALDLTALAVQADTMAYYKVERVPAMKACYMTIASGNTPIEDASICQSALAGSTDYFLCSCYYSAISTAPITFQIIN